MTKKAKGKKDAVGDINKPRLSFIPKEAIWLVGKALTYGEKHYGAHNFKNGIMVTHSIDASLRHIFEFLDGEDIDQKSQNHHLGNAIANLCIAIYTLSNNPELDDRCEKDKLKHGNIKSKKTRSRS